MTADPADGNPTLQQHRLTFPHDGPFELSDSAERAQEKLAGSGRITGRVLTFLKELNPELRKR